MGTWVSEEGYFAYFDETAWNINLYYGGVGLSGKYTIKRGIIVISYTHISDDGGVNWRPITSEEEIKYAVSAKFLDGKLIWGIRTYSKIAEIILYTE